MRNLTHKSPKLKAALNQSGHWLVNLCHGVPRLTLFILYSRICRAEKKYANDLLYNKMGLTYCFKRAKLFQSNNFTDRSSFSGEGLPDNNARAM